MKSFIENADRFFSSYDWPTNEDVIRCWFSKAAAGGVTTSNFEVDGYKYSLERLSDWNRPKIDLGDFDGVIFVTDLSAYDCTNENNVVV